MVAVCPNFRLSAPRQDIQVADLSRLLPGGGIAALGEVGMAVVPADEVSSGVAAAKLFVWHAELAAPRHPDRVYDRVVAGTELGRPDAATHLDASEVSESFALSRCLVHARDALDPRMVGHHAGAHEPERRRKAIKDVDREAPVQEQIRA